MAKKNYQYFRGATFVINGETHTIATQLYMTGIYGIFDNDPAQQMNLSGGQVEKLFKDIQKDFDNGKITKLELRSPITITKDEDGFYVEV